MILCIKVLLYRFVVLLLSVSETFITSIAAEIANIAASGSEAMTIYASKISSATKRVAFL